MEIINLIQEKIEEAKTVFDAKEFPHEHKQLESYLSDLDGVDEAAGIFVAGGAITSLFTNQDVNDIDIYFRSKESFSFFLASILNNDTCYLRAVNVSDRSILFTNHNDMKIQLIYYKWFPTVQDIFNDFDFSVNMGAYDAREQKFIFHKNFLKHNAQRYIEINTNTAFPLVSVLRVDKYREKGYKVAKAQMLRLLLRVSQTGMNSWEDVLSQCGGMYGIEPKDLFDQTQPFSVDEAIRQLGMLSPDKQKMGGMTKSCLVQADLYDEDTYPKLQGKVVDYLYDLLSHSGYVAGKSYDKLVSSYLEEEGVFTELENNTPTPPKRLEKPDELDDIF